MNEKILHFDTYHGALDSVVGIIKNRTVDLDVKHILLVPEKDTLKAEQRLFSGGGAFDVEVLSLSRWFFKLGGAAVLPPAGAVMIIKDILYDMELKCFFRSKGFEGFCARAYDTFCDLESDCVDIESLGAGGGLGLKLDDLKRIYKEYKRRTEGMYVGKSGKIKRIIECLSYVENTENSLAGNTQESICENLSSHLGNIINNQNKNFENAVGNSPENIAEKQNSRDGKITENLSVYFGNNENCNAKNFSVCSETITENLDFRLVDKVGNRPENTAINLTPKNINPPQNNKNPLENAHVYACGFGRLTALEKQLFALIAKNALSFTRAEVGGRPLITADVEIYKAASTVGSLKAAAGRIRTLLHSGAAMESICVVAPPAAFPQAKRIFGEYGLPHYIDHAAPLPTSRAAEYLRLLLDLKKLSRRDFVHLSKNPLGGIAPCDSDVFENYCESFLIDYLGFSRPFTLTDSTKNPAAEAERLATAERVRATLYRKVSALWDRLNNLKTPRGFSPAIINALETACAEYEQSLSCGSYAVGFSATTRVRFSTKNPSKNPSADRELSGSAVGLNESFSDYNVNKNPSEGESFSTKNPSKNDSAFGGRLAGNILAHEQFLSGLNAEKNKILGVLAALDRYLCEGALDKKRLQFLIGAFLEGANSETLEKLPRTSGCVVIGDAGIFRGGRFSHTFVIGFTEGVIPKTATGRGLITRAECDALNKLGAGLPNESEINEQNEYELLQLFAASDNLFLSYTASGDERPSPLLYEVISEAKNIKRGGTENDLRLLSEGSDDELVRLAGSSSAGLELFILTKDNPTRLTSSLYAALGQSAERYLSPQNSESPLQNSAQNYNQNSINNGQSSQISAQMESNEGELSKALQTGQAANTHLQNSPQSSAKPLQNSAQNISQSSPCNPTNTLQNSAQHSEQNYAQNPSQQDKATDSIAFQTKEVSASRLQSYFLCPYKHFVEYGLRAARKKSGKADRADIGTAVHKVNQLYSHCGFDKDKLDEIIDGVLSGGVYDLKQNERLKLRLKKEIKEVCASFGEKLTRGSFRRVGEEIRFGENEPVKGCRLGDVTLKGSVDFADSFEGYVRIIDYKTGFAKLDETDIYYGKSLQLPLYMLTMRENGYQSFAMLYFVFKSSWAENGYFSGFYLADKQLLLATDPSLDEDNPVLPAKIKTNKDGTEKITCPGGKDTPSWKKAAVPKNAAVMEAYLDYARDVATLAAAQIQDGNIAPSPLKYDGKRACDYCGFRVACGFRGSFRTMQTAKIVSNECEEGGEADNE